MSAIVYVVPGESQKISLSKNHLGQNIYIHNSKKINIEFMR